MRRQLRRDFRKPLIIMTPKSLLRHKMAVSNLSEFDKGTSFKKMYAETGKLAADAKIRRVVFCTGKVYYDLLQAREETKISDIAILRIEQLYPLYEEKLKRTVAPYTNARKFVWCQEEPQNMGAWTFILPRLLNLFPGYIYYAGRPSSASPAAGTMQMHQREQAALVKQAFEV